MTDTFIYCTKLIVEMCEIYETETARHRTDQAYQLIDRQYNKMCDFYKIDKEDRLARLELALSMTERMKIKF